jgi:hypothetical protein
MKWFLMLHLIVNGDVHDYVKVYKSQAECVAAGRQVQSVMADDMPLRRGDRFECTHDTFADSDTAWTFCKAC